MGEQRNWIHSHICTGLGWPHPFLPPLHPPSLLCLNFVASSPSSFPPVSSVATRRTYCLDDRKFTFTIAQKVAQYLYGIQTDEGLGGKLGTVTP